MEMRQKFTTEFKPDAVRPLQKSAKPAAVIARELGIPRNRLYKWAQDAERKGERAFRGSGRPKAHQDELAVLQRENARLKEENEILTKSGGVLRVGVVVGYAWITAQAGYAVQTMCKTLDVSSSAYHAWRSRRPSGRMLDTARLLQRIRHLHSVPRKAYGTERNLAKALTRTVREDRSSIPINLSEKSGCPRVPYLLQDACPRRHSGPASTGAGIVRSEGVRTFFFLVTVGRQGPR
jgi:transposase